MPSPTPQKLNLNTATPSELDSLKKKGIPQSTITRLKRLRATGGTFRTREDLGLIGLAPGAIDDVLRAGAIDLDDLLTPVFKSVPLTTRPPRRFGYSLHFRAEKEESKAVFAGDTRISADGTCTIRYLKTVEGGMFELSVTGPDGGLVGIEWNRKTGLHLEVPERDLTKHTLIFEPRRQVTRTPVDPVPPVRIRGRVVCPDPKRKVSGLPVVVFASLQTKPDDFFPVCYAETEDRGYFMTGTPVFPQREYRNLQAAYANVGGTTQPIHLDNDPKSGKQMLPARVILYLDGAIASGLGEDKECGCQNLDFLEKKVLDEFTYYTVVRTTEPKIEALKLSEVNEVNLEDLVAANDPVRETLAGSRLPWDIVNSFLDHHPNLDKDEAKKLVALARKHQIRERARAKRNSTNGRVHLDGSNGIDWDLTPTIYQATSVAYGHLLQFKQEWLADGYSIGDLLYSLPLAPGQKKQIVVFDWDRKESAANTQRLDYQDNLYNSLSRDRDVNEIAGATLTEHLEGNSDADNWAAGGGGALGAAIPIPAGPIVIPVGGLIGAAGGASGSSASSLQDASRETTANSEQHLKDRTLQAANSVRSQRSTVIQTVAQGERFEVSAEVVANYNHCHALTIQYFEVIRHFEIRSRLASVRECIFVPLEIRPFTRMKALRWRNILARCLKNRALIRGFAAMERIDEEFESSIENYYDRIGFPKRRFAEEDLEYLEGEIRLEFRLFRPPDDPAGDQIPTEWQALSSLLGADFYQQFIAVTQARDEAFEQHAGKLIADDIINRLRFSAGRNGRNSRRLPLEATLMTEFQVKKRLLVSLRLKGDVSTFKREEIDFVEISIDTTNDEDISEVIKKNVRIIVHSGSMRYRTAHLHETLFRESHINNDLTLEGDEVRIYTPLSRQALRNPRGEDAELHNSLLHHLNENLEYYHQCIWSRMDPQRRFLLLDGIVVPDKGKNRSVASVAENKLIGIVGNCLVLPVAAGNRLDLTLNEDVNLFDHYHTEPPEPAHASLPTKGVYTEAVMGQCNSCERKEEERFWRWQEAPTPDSPTTINPVSMPTPQVTEPNPQPQALTAPIINLQNAPAAPDPQGFGALAQLLSNANLFRDVTGLTETQKNSITALQRAFQSSEFFGGQAAELTRMAAALSPEGQKLEQIRQARAHNLIDEPDAKEQTKAVLDSGGQAINLSALKQLPQIAEKLKEAGIEPERAREIVAGIADNFNKPEARVTDALFRIPTENAGSFELTEKNSAGDERTMKFSESSEGAEKDYGSLSHLVDGALTFGQAAVLQVVDVLRKHRDNPELGVDPNGELAIACREVLIKAAKKKLKEEGEKATKKFIPMGHALIIAIKLSLAFADGVGEEFLKMRNKMRAKFNDEIDRAQIDSDGMSPDAMEAMENLRAWQARNTQELGPIFENGLRRMIEKAGNLALEEIQSTLSKAFTGFVKDIVKENELVMVVADGLNYKRPKEREPRDVRRRALEGTLRFMASVFAKQLSDPRMRTGLETSLKEVKGKNPAIVDLFAGAIRAVIDLETPELKQGLGEAFLEVREFLIQAMRTLKLEFDAEGTFKFNLSPDNDVEADETSVSAPQSLITLITPVPSREPTQLMKDAADAFFATKAITEDRLKVAAYAEQRRVNRGLINREDAEDRNIAFTLSEVRIVVDAYGMLDEVVRKEGLRVGDPDLPINADVRERYTRLYLGEDLVIVWSVMPAGSLHPFDRHQSARVIVATSDRVGGRE